MMGENQKNTLRAKAAMKAIIDGRDCSTDASEIMVTIEHTVAALLLMLYRKPELAAGMLNEALVQGIESRLALHAARQAQP